MRKLNETNLTNKTTKILKQVLKFEMAEKIEKPLEIAGSFWKKTIEK